MGWNTHLSKRLVCLFAVFALCRARIYTNHWAVRITEGPDVADSLAVKYDYTNMGQSIVVESLPCLCNGEKAVSVLYGKAELVAYGPGLFTQQQIGDLNGYYHFYHSKTIKRSTLLSRGRHSFIFMEPKVKWFQQQEIKRKTKLDNKAAPPRSIHFNDPEWTRLWDTHCSPDSSRCQSNMNIESAWRRGYTGKNVVVTVLDDSRIHPDLMLNYDSQASYDFIGNDPYPMPQYDASNENKHGRRSAGEIADSADCTVGIAFDARIWGVGMFGGDVTDMQEAQALSLQPQGVDIYSVSWGPGDSGTAVDGPGSLVRRALKNGVRTGRKGRGSIFVWASGSGGRSHDHGSCDGYTNSIHTISISSAVQNGTRPWFLEECSSTLATTQSSREANDKNILIPDLRQRCTESLTGRSASAPMAAGIIALTLEANPQLTWRDVQHIIVKTSRSALLSAPDWRTNAAGHNVSHLYGFGLMDAEAMVREAERWRQVPTQHICVERAEQTIRTLDPELVVRSVQKATGCSDSFLHHVAYLEHVVVRLSLSHPRHGDLSIFLTSPSGTTSQLLGKRLLDRSAEGFKNWEFMSTHYWGETAAGDWILEIHDSPSPPRSEKVPGKLKEWSLILHGTSKWPYPYPNYKRPRSVETSTDDDLEDYSGPCDPECTETGCDGPGPEQCFSCLHYVLRLKNNTRTCLSQCPPGFYPDSKKRCKKCPSLCETCTGGRSEQCTSCLSGYHLSEGLSGCVSECGDGRYLDNDGNMCRKCNVNCLKCTSFQVCTECMPSLSCVVSCDSGTYFDSERRTCEPCHPACATCTGGCLTCEEPLEPVSDQWRYRYPTCEEDFRINCPCCAGKGLGDCNSCVENYLLEDWRCVPSCSATFYPVALKSESGALQRSCQKCDSRCLTCVGSGPRNCTGCATGYSLEAGVCLVNGFCRDGEYQDEHGTCLPCDTSCLRCKGPGDSECTHCSPTRYLDEGQCVLNCSLGKYPSDGQCHLCDPTCGECLGRGADDCTGCDRGECLDSCPDGHFHSLENTCLPCPESCRACNAPNWCLTCNDSFYLSDGVCTRLECGEGQVEDPDYADCMPCEEGCRNCVLYNPKHCLSCTEGFYKFQDSCYGSCPAKTYGAEDMTCVKCDEDCVSCDEKECFWCEADFFLSGGECVQECQEGLYGNEDTQVCEVCHADCRTCGGPNKDECRSCEPGKRLKNGVCVPDLNSCPATSFLNDEGECEACHSSCQSCSGVEKSHCISCVRGRFLTRQHTCVGKCLPGSFGNITTGLCEDCVQGCLQCVDNERCLRCLSDRSKHLYLQDGKCVRQCQGGFPVGRVCHSCARHCASCDGNTTHCLSCTPPHVLLAHQCVATCPETHVLRDGRCQPCPPACRECSVDGLCSECEEFHFLHRDHCVKECPRGFYLNVGLKACEDCHPDCSLCVGPEQHHCGACAAPGLVLHSGQCRPECPTGTYHDTHTRECQDCDESCLECTGPSVSSCASCGRNTRLDPHGRCVPDTECSSRFYKNQEGRCLHCHKYCLRCNGPAQFHCLSCNKNHFLLNNTCVDGCPVGFFGDKEEQQCGPCHPTCLSCSGGQSFECLACKPHLFREGKECVENCQNSYYGNTSTRTCDRCDRSCGECYGSGTSHCLSCRPGLFFLKTKGHCHHTCPQGYYGDDQQMTCEKCHPSCKTCTEKGFMACESCDMGYTLSGGMCESQCIMGQYFISEGPNEGKCEPCDVSCLSCKGPGPNNCTMCPTQVILSAGGRCIPCCGNQTHPLEDHSSQSQECCNCTETTEYCILTTSDPLNGQDYSGNPIIFISTSVFLLLALGTAAFVFVRPRYRDVPKERASGYEKLGGQSVPSFPSEHAQRDQLVDLSDYEDEDEDIVYMGQDGTVYRRFQYGSQGDDDEDETKEENNSYII